MVEQVLKTATVWRQFLKDTPYFQPQSPIWWAGLVAVLAGIVKALAVTQPSLAPVVVIIDLLSAADMSPGMLVAIGMAVMGLKADVDKPPTEPK
jgi:hypothetical protein